MCQTKLRMYDTFKHKYVYICVHVCNMRIHMYASYIFVYIYTYIYIHEKYVCHVKSLRILLDT